MDTIKTTLTSEQKASLIDVLHKRSIGICKRVVFY